MHNGICRNPVDVTVKMPLLWGFPAPAEARARIGDLDSPVSVRLAIDHAGTANALPRNVALATCIATRVEKRRPLPGDKIVPEPMFTVTHSITIDAPIERVWPWLAQMGSDRAGWYS